MIRTKLFLFFSGVILLSTSWTSAQNKNDLTKFVNPFIGTGGHGHTYPGPSLPFGMVQLGPDTRLTGWDGCSGYHYSDNIVYGFSHTHLSGTGIADYCDILLMPTTGEPRFKNSDYSSPFNKKNEKASAGFYATRLDKYGVDVELTSTLRAGFHKYKYPNTRKANIIIDLQHRDQVLDSWIEVINDHEIKGFRRSKSWAADQPIYFHAKFSKPFKSYGIAVNDQVQPGIKKASGTNIKMFIQFENPGEVLSKVGISSVDAFGALKNLDSEIADFNFKKIREQARTAWNKELNKIRVESEDLNKLSIFYTALYHTLLNPNLFTDVDGRYLGMDKKVHRAEKYQHYTVFSLWDTYRAQHPLLNLIDRKRSSDFVNTFISDYRESGLLPIWPLGNNETYCMIGNHSIPVILDAYRKGIKGFDAEKAFEAMKSAVNRTEAGFSSYKENGGVLADDEPESVSKTLEYAYDDWCIAQMAQLLGKEKDYNTYIQRAQYWKNVYDDQSGFMRARTNGGWYQPFKPTDVNNNYTEANSWQYSFYVPQDVNTLVEKMGGISRFEEKLDQLFTTTETVSGREQADITGLIGQYAHGNEPSHHMAYLYNFTANPSKTQYYVNQIMNGLYSNTPDGLAGNEDCGQMSAWLVMSALGFYPVNPASGEYLVGVPWFKSASVQLENGKMFRIENPSYSKDNIYLQDLRLNNSDFSRLSISQKDIMDGGKLEFTTGKLENKNFMNGLKKPVSEITDGLITPNPVIHADSKTFKDKLSVSITGANQASEIHYTLDGSIPSTNSAKYDHPVTINGNTTIKAISILNDKSSFVVSAEFVKVAGDRKVEILSQYSKSYTGGGDDALIDGIRGKKDYRLGNFWQGYWGNDFEATVDLGTVRPVRKLGLGTLQDTNAWIIFPRDIEFWISQDGQNFSKVQQVNNTIDARDYTLQVKDFISSVDTKARFIKVKAKNFGDLPDWHAGYPEKGKAYIFVDEIIVK